MSMSVLIFVWKLTDNQAHWCRKWLTLDSSCCWYCRLLISSICVCNSSLLAFICFAQENYADSNVSALFSCTKYQHYFECCFSTDNKISIIRPIVKTKTALFTTFIHYNHTALFPQSLFCFTDDESFYCFLYVN
jgi:hypothetical protein